MLPNCTCVKVLSPTQNSYLQWEQEAGETKQIRHCVLGSETHGSRVLITFYFTLQCFSQCLEAKGHNSHHFSDTNGLPHNRISSFLSHKLQTSFGQVVAFQKLSGAPPRIGWEESALSSISLTCQMTC